MPRLKKLTKAQRARLPKSDFVFPERAPAVGSYPINVKARAMVAIQLAQLSAKGRRDLPKVKKAVFARYPSLIAWWNKNHPDKKWRGKRPQRARTYRRREEIDLAANPATRKQIEDKIAQIEDSGRWHSMSNDFHGMAMGGDEEMRQYYPDWDDDDFREVYGHFEGKLAQLDLDDARRDRGYRSNIGEGYATEEDWEEFAEYGVIGLSASLPTKSKSKKKKKTKKKAKSRGFKPGKQEAISAAKRQLRTKYRNKDKNWFNKTKTSERFQEEWIETRRKIVKRYTRKSNPLSETGDSAQRILARLKSELKDKKELADEMGADFWDSWKNYSTPRWSYEKFQEVQEKIKRLQNLIKRMEEKEK